MSIDKNNLPKEIADAKRFFPVVITADGRKKPDINAWENPKNQTTIDNIRGLVGFAITGQGTDYLFVDFDNVLDDSSNFVNADAEKWFNYLATTETFCEKSISGHGLHFFFKPTPKLFKNIKFTGGNNGSIFLDPNNDKIKIEVFYRQNRYCLLTGDIFCSEKNIEDGEIADEIFQQLINAIAAQNHTTDMPATDLPQADFPIAEAQKALFAIPCQKIERNVWAVLGMALKDTYGNKGFDIWDAWSKSDQKRYDEAVCQYQWKHFGIGKITKPVTIATLIYFAKKFSYQPPRRDEKDLAIFADDTRTQLADWQQRNGKINPDVLPKLKNALDKLAALAPDNLTASDVYNAVSDASLACAYGFSSAADNLFAALKKAKATAKEKLAVDKSGLAAKLSDEEEKKFIDIDVINVSRLRDDIDRKSTAIAKAHKQFRREENARAAAERHAKILAEREAKYKSDETLLDSLKAQPPSPERDAKIIETIRKLCEWRHDSKGNPIDIRATAANANLIFTFDPVLDGLFGYDEFKQADVFLKRPPWKKDSNCIGDEWRDSDDNETCLYLRNHYKDFAAKDLFFQCVTHYSNLRSFHEVKNFFNNLPKWDGTKRAAKLFIKFLRVEDTPYARAVTMNWLVAAVARIFHPACPYQTALVLHGGQGIGKSFILERLGGKWYSAIIDNVDDPHAIDDLKNTWIGEFKEMAGMRKAELNAIKSFIERSEDNRRAAYERRAAKIKRQCVFAITVNDDHFLTDTTGNRRYLILHCNSKPLDYVEGLTNEYIQQVWAEVLQYCKELFKDGFDSKKLELSREFRIQAEEIAQQYLRDDGMQGEIKAFLDTKILPLVIWNLLSREERRKYFVDGGCLTMIDALTEFNHRRRARGGKPNDVQRDVNLIYAFLEDIAGKNFVRKESITRNGNSVEEYHIYGSTPREHICATEIYNECFGSDKRKSMQRIHEILPTLDNWEQGKRIGHDFVYGNQRKVFYRTEAKQ